MNSTKLTPAMSTEGLNLEYLLSPHLYEGEKPLPKTNPEVPGGYYLSGFISEDCEWGCRYNESILHCFPVEKFFKDRTVRSRISPIAVSRSSYAFPGERITCATEVAIHNQRISSGIRKLLLGLCPTKDNNDRDLKGAVVLFDPLKGIPLKRFHIAEPVSSITVLSHYERGGSSLPFLNGTMKAMRGIAAIGLQGGTVLIVDLVLDDPNLLTTRNTSALTYNLLVVNPEEPEIVEKRLDAISKEKSIALQVTDEDEPQGVDDQVNKFNYCQPTEETILVLPKNCVAVSCLQYVPSVGALLVGFTCGTFQLWGVNNLKLQYSSEPPEKETKLPVFGFSFQQLVDVDNVQNHCYLWVAYGNPYNECESANIKLHRLRYERKTCIEKFGVAYSGFKGCVMELNIELEDDMLSKDTENGNDTVRSSARPLRIWTESNGALMFCSWEVGRGGTYYVGVFDLKQWYLNPTKDKIVYNNVTGLCPFWIVLAVNVPNTSSIVMDVRLIPKSLMRWENLHAKLYVHFYPASISFRAVCLANQGVSAFQHFGVQEKLIRCTIKEGFSLLIEPANLKKYFMQYGLQPVYPLTYREDLSEKDRDRFYIFTALLESRRAAEILSLANAWLNGSYANLSLIIDLIIDWICNYTLSLTALAESAWQEFFSISDHPVRLHRSGDFIYFSNFAWNSLKMLLTTLMKQPKVCEARELALRDMKLGLGKLVKYSAAILMMYKMKLLPQNDSNFMRDWTNYYEQRRSESQAALDASPYVDSPYKNCHPLMIDYLMEAVIPKETIREEWHISKWEPLYPPRHIGYLINMLMWSDADPQAVSRVFMYFLLDISFILAKGQNHNAASTSRVAEPRLVGDFRAVLGTTLKEHSEVLSLWQLDHDSQGEILIRLKEKNRLFEKDGLPWCASALVLTASGYERDIAELLMKSCPPKLARLLFSLMTSSDENYSSLVELLMTTDTDTGKNEELLRQFFLISKARGRLDGFMKNAKKLTAEVKSALLKFLRESSNSLDDACLPLIFYIYEGNYEKLEESLINIRSKLHERNLFTYDSRKLTLKESCIKRLLNIKIGNHSMQLQTSQIAEQMSKILNITASPASESGTTTPVKSKDWVPKLPSQLGRKKLSETISDDPLSPLRRNAGGKRNSVAGFSGGNSTAFEKATTSEEGRNLSLRQTKGTKVNLLALVKTPSIDHRLMKKNLVYGEFNNMYITDDDE
ncbi:unnamed protein product [Orchesella dallaii]|uniref:ELYS beta-propeller domain-containing protein n=1 Tax=Orchesella dallaii TaxID=48710 RepID=A0ABP1R2U6_9HEXA